MVADLWSAAAAAAAASAASAASASASSASSPPPCSSSLLEGRRRRRQHQQPQAAAAAAAATLAAVVAEEKAQQRDGGGSGSDDDSGPSAGGPPPPERGGGNKDNDGPARSPSKAPFGQKAPDYYANVGDAIRTLREDVPRLFERDLDYRIYRDDVVFRDPRNAFSGISNYRLIFWSLRFHGRLFFSKLTVEVRRVWQPDDACVRLRWTVRGVPRVPWEAEGVFDGVSTYKLDRAGKVYEHSVDNVILRDPPMQRLWSDSPLLAGLRLEPQSVPVPGAWGHEGGGGAP